MEYLTEQKGNGLNRVGMQKYTINAHFTIYLNCPKKTLKGEFEKSQGELSGSHPLRSDDSMNSQTGDCERWPKALKTKLAQGCIRLESAEIRWFL
jgi:hypothetical protein